MSHIITAGPTFTDIDALACIEVFYEFCKLSHYYQDVEKSYSLNFSPSVTKSVLSLIETGSYESHSIDDSFVLMDVSELEYLQSIDFPVDNVVEIFDHHRGSRDFWCAKLFDKCHIESVGACTTLVYEFIKKHGYIDKLSNENCLLLCLGTVSNTLNLQAQITTDRDRQLIDELGSRIGLDDDIIGSYFEDISSSLRGNIQEGLSNDTKIRSVLGEKTTIGQLELWDIKSFLDENMGTIRSTMLGFGNEQWFFNGVSVSEGCNYILCEDETLQKVLSLLFGAQFVDDIGATDKLRLRKELLRDLSEYYSNDGEKT